MDFVSKREPNLHCQSRSCTHDDAPR